MVMPIKLREMEILHAVVKTRTMSAAARQLHTSQPAVSQAVRSIEQRLGVSLFLREGNRVRPTPELLELFKELDLIFNTVESARRLAAVLNQGAGRVVRIGAIPSLASALLPRAAASLRERFPEVQIWMRFQDPAPIKDAIIRRDFDLGLMFGEGIVESLETIDLCTARMVCLLREDDPLAGEPVLTPTLLKDRALISFGTMSPIGEDLDDIFLRDDVADRQIVVQTSHSHVAAGLVRYELGIALTDPFFLGSTPLHGLVVRPFAPARNLTPRLVHVRGRQLSNVETVFIQNLKDSATHWVSKNKDRFSENV